MLHFRFRAAASLEAVSNAVLRDFEHVLRVVQQSAAQRSEEPTPNFLSPATLVDLLVANMFVVRHFQQQGSSVGCQARGTRENKWQGAPARA